MDRIVAEVGWLEAVNGPRRDEAASGVRGGGGCGGGGGPE